MLTEYARTRSSTTFFATAPPVAVQRGLPDGARKTRCPTGHAVATRRRGESAPQHRTLRPWWLAWIPTKLRILLVRVWPSGGRSHGAHW